MWILMVTSVLSSLKTRFLDEDAVAAGDVEPSLSAGT